MKEGIEQRFLEDVKDHQMTILRDDGVNRHLRFKKPGESAYYFDLVTWNNVLVIQGDTGNWMFSRIEDMFQFFRVKPGHFGYGKEDMYINPGYWSEKLLAVDNRSTRGDSGPMQYSEERFKAVVGDYFNQYCCHEALGRKKKQELWEAIKDEVLDAENEYEAHQKAREFEHNGFQFHDFWEQDLREYTYHYLWCLYAIVWGIQVYDRASICHSCMGTGGKHGDHCAEAVR